MHGKCGSTEVRINRLLCFSFQAIVKTTRRSLTSTVHSDQVSMAAWRGIMFGGCSVPHTVAWLYVPSARSTSWVGEIFTSACPISLRRWRPWHLYIYVVKISVCLARLEGLHIACTDRIPRVVDSAFVS